MWKWIAGGCSLLIIVVCVILYLGYQKMKGIAAGGPTTAVTIAAKPQRVFASMSNGDSLANWRIEGTGLTLAHKGPLVVGDSLHSAQSNGRSSRITWVVTTIVPNSVIAFEAVMDSTGRSLFGRRDSLVAAGDSTRVMSTFVATMFDSLKAIPGQKPVSGGMANVAATMATAGMRMVAEQELQKLKAHIEGRPFTPPDSK